MAKARKTWPERIQFFASLPWQYPETALKELKRARKAGACGVMVLAMAVGTEPPLRRWATSGTETPTYPVPVERLVTITHTFATSFDDKQ